MGDKTDDECPEFVLGPGNVPIPNTDPECAEVIKRRREKLKDKVPVPFDPVTDLIDSFAKLFGVTRFVVTVAALGYGFHYLHKRKR